MLILTWVLRSESLHWFFLMIEESLEELCRWLAFTALRETYADHPECLDEGMGLVSSNLLDAMKTGVDVGSPGAPMILRLAVTGIKGDWPFLIECGRLQRHFRRAPKRGQSSMQSEGVCHLCLAGYDGIPFTDVTAAPRFEETMSSAAVSCLCLCWNRRFSENIFFLVWPVMMSFITNWFRRWPLGRHCHLGYWICLQSLTFDLTSCDRMCSTIGT